MSASQLGLPNYIYAGKDGYLFVVHGSNDVVALYRDTVGMTDLLWNWRHHISTRERRLRAMGITYRHIVVPEKSSIYDNLLDGLKIDVALSPALRLWRQDPFYDQSPLRKLNVVRYLRRRARWRRTMIDLVRPMREARERIDLYFRTDSHWKFAGCQFAYFEICKALGARPHLDFAQRRSERFPHHAGDLGAACTPPRTEDMTMIYVQRDAERVYASPIVEHRERKANYQTLHSGAHVVFRNESAPDTRTLVLFGDSYAHFVPIMLTAMLAETFRELHFVWATSIDYGYVSRVKPDIVLTEMAERFMYRLPDESFDIEAYARERYGDELDAEDEAGG